MCKNSPTPTQKAAPAFLSTQSSYAEKFQVPRAVTTEDKVLPCLVKASFILSRWSNLLQR